MRKLGTLSLVLVLLLTSIVPAFAEVTVTPPGEFPIVTEPVTLQVFARQSANIPDIETNAFTVAYEEMTGVHLEWELAPSNALAEKKGISLASGNYPDFYLGTSMTREEQMLYGSRGVFIPLNDLIEQYNPELMKLMEQEPLLAQMMYAPDGNIYSYPTANETLHVTVPNRMWINTTWLNQLGMDAPTTTEEYYEVLKAFKGNDLNGNGKADEIPLIIPEFKGSSGNTGIGFIMCAFVYYDAKDGFIVDNDDVVSVAFNTEGWREGLAFLNRLYAEQLLDNASFTVTSDQVKQLMENADAMILGGAPALAPSSIANLSGDRHQNYDALTPLIGPEGVQTTAWSPYQHDTGSLVITSACENPEVVARWIDWLYTWEGALNAREGVEGLSWQRPEAGTLSYTGEEATWERITAYGEASNFKWDGMGFPHNMLIHPEQASNTDIYASNGQPARLYKIASEQYVPYIPDKVLPPMFMDTDVIKDYSKMKTDINKYVEDYSVMFITGAADIHDDAQWASYLAYFDTLKLDDYIQITQEAYDDFLSNVQ